MGKVIYLNIAVSCYSGYKANERPFAFAFHGQKFEVERILRRWYNPKGESWFVVATTSGRRFRLAYCPARDIWILEDPDDSNMTAGHRP